MQSQTFTAMGSRINALWDSDAPPPAEWLALPDTFEAWEQSLSRFRPDSELSRLNAQSNVAIPVSDTLAEVLAVAHTAAEMSEGLVIPTLLAQLEAWGYTRDFEELAAVTPHVIPRTPVAAWNAVTFEPRTKRVILHQGVRLDLGGVAKGWAADTLAHRFASHAPVLIDVGGDIAVSGARADSGAWAIAVKNPFTPDDPTPLRLALLKAGGIATSGRDYRQWQVGAQQAHHIIDPRTGDPAASDVLTATVIAPSAVEAEVAAKVVVIRGSEAGLAWIAQRPTLAACVVCANGDTRFSDLWRQHDWHLLYQA